MKLDYLPDFSNLINKSSIPKIKIKKIHFENFKVYDDCVFNFTDQEDIKNFVCLIGPNGCGKTTILDAIQVLFSRYDGYELKRLKCLLGKSVRHKTAESNAIYGDDDFLITAEIKSSLGDYEIQLNKSGFIKDHPDDIKWIIYRLCYSTRFDMDLMQPFQLPREKWPIFKDLFESITGYEIFEQTTLFDQSDDKREAELLKTYVLGFFVRKPHEIISYRECSAGEKKVIKSFSTLLNKEYSPQIILIDNIEMHVETGRHIEVINSLRRSFPNEQIFSTTHSTNIIKNYKDRKSIYDLRLLKASDIVKKEPWRLYFIDEIKDMMFRLNGVVIDDDMVKHLIEYGNKLLYMLENKDNAKNEIFIKRENELETSIDYFVKATYDLTNRNILNFYSKEGE